MNSSGTTREMRFELLRQEYRDLMVEIDGLKALRWWISSGLVSIGAILVTQVFAKRTEAFGTHGDGVALLVLAFFVLLAITFNVYFEAIGARVSLYRYYVERQLNSMMGEEVAIRETRYGFVAPGSTRVVGSAGLVMGVVVIAAVVYGLPLYLGWRYVMAGLTWLWPVFATGLSWTLPALAAIYGWRKITRIRRDRSVFDQVVPYPWEGQGRNSSS